MRAIMTALAVAMFLASGSRIAPAEEAKAAPTTQPIYDEHADAAQDIAAAERRAGFENQRVLLDIGGNWCHWCTLLHTLFVDDHDIRILLRSEYQVVYVDSGEKNRALLDSYGLKMEGVPFLAILGPDNKLIVQQNTGPLEDGPKHDPKKVLAFLDQWKAAPLEAQKVLGDSLADARAHGKRVFVHFGAPWCGWCHRLEDVLYQPAVTDAIGSEFIVVKIDTQRMPGGADLLRKYRGTGGIPWYAILSADGKVASTSQIGENNIGFPTEPNEIDHVMHMFTDGRTHITDAQATAIRDALTKAAAAANATH